MVSKRECGKNVVIAIQKIAIILDTAHVIIVSDVFAETADVECFLLHYEKDPDGTCIR